MIINNIRYIAHTDPIFKKMHMVKVTDMFRIAIYLSINRVTLVI